MKTNITYFPRAYSEKEKKQLKQHSKLHRTSQVAAPPTNPYHELLREQGIFIEDEIIEEEDPTTGSSLLHECLLPSLPVSWSSEGIPQFSTRQLSWAAPEDFGWQEYEVVERTPPFGISYAEEVSLPKRRPPHKYNRIERFRNILNNLMLGSGYIPQEILELVPQQLAGDMWEELRCILKQKNLRRYYNRIPGILCSSGHLKYEMVRKPQLYDNVMSDFCELHHLFDKRKASLNRVYFPNLRYICLRLLERHDVSLPLSIPRARTSKKLASLDETFDAMWMLID